MAIRRACIDIGSNTTRLLVADVGADALHEVVQLRAFTHLRRALGADGTLTEAVLDAVADVVGEQLACAREHRAQEVTVVATAAVRRAANPEALVARLEDRFGIALQVLSEEEEGEFAFLGAYSALVARDGPEVAGTSAAVVDVGGGSCELVRGALGGPVAECVSLPLGSGVLTDVYLAADPPLEGEIAAAERHVDEVLAAVPVASPVRALAVGGSAMSLCAMAGSRLDPAAFAAALAELRTGPAASVALRLGLPPERVRLLPGGLLILRALQGRLGVPLEPVPGGLREGILLACAGER